MLKKLKYIALGLIGALGLIFAVVVAVDASRISGIKLTQVNETDYKVELKGEEYTLGYVPKENIQPLFGKALFEFGYYPTVLVRADLPPQVQRSVMHHEIYHLYDFSRHLHKGRSREIHAMLASIPYEPLGFLQTVLLTLADKDRRAYYHKYF